MSQLVLVTGANGYIGCTIVKLLLEQGYRVRGTVRDPSDEKKTATLKAFPNASTHLELVKFELSDPDPGNILKDVAWVMHTAAWVRLEKVKDEENEVIKPAVNGTLSLLRAALKEATVEKFILTSSIAAIRAGHPDDRTEPFTEQDWSILDGPGVLVYSKAKTLAEKAAWEFMDQHDCEFTLSTINPSFVLGPVTSDSARSSTVLLSRLMAAKDPGLPNIFFSIVDVRDVAQAHIQAAKMPEAAGKRFILNQTDGGELFMPEIARILRDEFGPKGYTIRSWVLPRWLVWLISLMDSNVAAFYPRLDQRVSFDNSQSRKVLQIEYIPAKRTLIEGVHSMIEHGLIERKLGK